MRIQTTSQKLSVLVLLTLTAGAALLHTGTASAQLAPAPTPVATPAPAPTPALVEPQPAYACKNPSRGGLQMSVPGLTETNELTGSIRIFKGNRVIQEVTPDMISEYENDGTSVSMVAKNSDGKQVMRLKTIRDEMNRMIIQAYTEKYGMIGFYCSKI